MFSTSWHFCQLWPLFLSVLNTFHHIFYQFLQYFTNFNPFLVTFMIFLPLFYFVRTFHLVLYLLYLYHFASILHYSQFFTNAHNVLHVRAFLRIIWACVGQFGHVCKLQGCAEKETYLAWCGFLQNISYFAGISHVFTFWRIHRRTDPVFYLGRGQVFSDVSNTRKCGRYVIAWTTSICVTFRGIQVPRERCIH